MATYLADHATSLSIATLKRRLSSISQAHLSAGHKSPTADPLVRRTMQGIRRIHGKPQKQAKPLAVTEIATIVRAIPRDLTGQRDRALILLGFAGALRRSELVGLDVRDLAFTAAGIRIVIRRSKTDPYGEGRIVDVPASDELTCPVAAVRGWLEGAAIFKGPLFRSIDRHGNLGSSALTGHAVANILKRRAEAVGIDPKSISGHSLRAGYATSAAIAGHTAWAIRQQTGHRSDEMVARYVRLAGNEEQARPPLL
ncbi:MAG: integrase [Ahrensia sp.]|nr:integrase [Ahrensia sp.]